MNFWEMLGLIAGCAMPLWNIPLIVRIWKRRSADDISLAWVAGVWVCVMAMLPSSLMSSDLVLKIFGIMNTIFFSGVFLVVLKFHPITQRNSR